ncbi:uncharacterized protein TNCV_381361 [Trichonephila clavipes]|uniref:Apple domain-containing protein n=1 Tax=Trichonephila clavipes TaxID=2585209 RepID=A0A8X6SAP1_TRICX|nr:uncharacterized protein TNCV_381361 [Trichonephila clavipes]
MAFWVPIVVIVSLIGPPAINSLEVTEIVYNFLFEDKLHEKWILYTADDGHMISCLQNCRNNSDCSGIAIGSFTEDSQNYSRTCHTLSGIDTADCEDDSCDTEGYMIFQKTTAFLETEAKIKILNKNNRDKQQRPNALKPSFRFFFICYISFSSGSTPLGSERSDRYAPPTQGTIIHNSLFSTHF